MENYNIRGAASDEEKARELFRTPLYCTDPLFDFAPHWFEGRVIDPSAGDGRAIESIIKRGNTSRHMVADIAEAEAQAWARNPLLADCDTHVGDYLSFHPEARYDALVTNPPFKLAQGFVEHAKQHVDGPICILQSTAWMGTQGRSRWFASDANLMWILNLARRPKWEFADGRVYSSNVWDYAWYVFQRGHTAAPQVAWLFAT